MKELFNTISVKLKDASEQLFDSWLRPEYIIPDVYEIQINDHANRKAKSIRFGNIQEAMSWVQSRDLLYEPNKNIFLIRIKPTGENDILRLNICNHVSTKRNAVHSAKKESKKLSAEVQ